MIGTIGGMKVELSKEELLWLVQNSNGNGNGHSYDPNAPQVGGSYGGGPEPHRASDSIPIDEQSALEEALNTRSPGAFMDQDDLVNEASALRAVRAAAAMLPEVTALVERARSVPDSPEPVAPVPPLVTDGLSASVGPSSSPTVSTPIPGAF